MNNYRTWPKNSGTVCVCVCVCVDSFRTLSIIGMTQSSFPVIHKGFLFNLKFLEDISPFCGTINRSAMFPSISGLFSENSRAQPMQSTNAWNSVSRKRKRGWRTFSLVDPVRIFTKLISNYLSMLILILTPRLTIIASKVFLPDLSDMTDIKCDHHKQESSQFKYLHVTPCYVLLCTPVLSRNVQS